MNEVNKHAYIFIVYNNFKVLEKTLELIDDERNDIYIHLDKKSEDFELLKKITAKLKKSKVYFTPRIDVRWGDYSQVECELLLLKEATKNKKYAYYHLLSESDMPLKNQNEIHTFFDRNQGKEFIEIQQFPKKKLFATRFMCYHIFSRNIKDKNKIIKYITFLVRKLFIILQYIFKYDKTKKYNMDIQYGSNWFSITDDFARYVLEKEDLIYKVFNHGVCVDEHFLQTIAYNSEFKNKLFVDGNMRMIIWKDNSNSPYVFKNSDYTMLTTSNKIFARKFQEKVDLEVVQNIFNNIKGVDEI